MSRYRNACNYFAKRRFDEGPPSKAELAADVNKAKEEATRFLRGLVFSMTDCVRKHIGHPRASVNNRSSMVVEILRRVLDELRDIVFGEPVLCESPLDIGHVTPSCDVLMLLWIDVTPDESSSAVPAPDEIQAASSFGSKKGFKTLPKRSTKVCEKSTKRTWPDAAKATSHNMLVNYLEVIPSIFNSIN